MSVYHKIDLIKIMKYPRAHEPLIVQNDSLVSTENERFVYPEINGIHDLFITPSLQSDKHKLLKLQTKLSTRI